MRKVFLVALTLSATSSFAQNSPDPLSEYQDSLEPAAKQTPSQKNSPDTQPKTTTISSSVSPKACTDSTQKSLPLKKFMSLLLEKNPSFEITSDPRTESLNLYAPKMIGNCRTMLDWKKIETSIDDKKKYALEVQFKKDSSCTPAGCSYTVATRVNDEVKFEPQIFQPTMKGFYECLDKTGVIANGKVNPGAIYPTPLMEKFDGIKESGDLVFVSNGPSAALIEPRYGKSFLAVDGCSHFEKISENPIRLTTMEDAEKAAKETELAEVKNCTPDNYEKLIEFMDKYDEYADILKNIRDELIIKAAAKSAKAISSGKYSEDDLKVFEDYQAYIVDPKIKRAIKLTNDLESAKDTEKKEIQNELNILMAEINKLNKPPYFSGETTLKLMAGGKWEDAEKVNSLNLFVDAYKFLGKKVDGKVVTPEVATATIIKRQVEFNKYLAFEKEKFESRTGERSDLSKMYAEKAKAYTEAIYNNYITSSENIRVLNACMSQGAQNQQFCNRNGGTYCYSFFRNVNRCVSETMQEIQLVQQNLAKANEQNQKEAEKNQKLYVEFTKYEDEGRRYLASQNGDTTPIPDTKIVDNTVVQPRSNNQGQFSFDFNAGGNGQQQTQFNNGQQIQNPQIAQQQYYQQQQYSQYPVMGSQNYNYYPQYNYQQPIYNPGGFQGSAGTFQWNGGGQTQYQQQWQGMNQQQYPGMYQQQNPGYWNNAYQAYGNFNLYGM